MYRAGRGPGAHPMSHARGCGGCLVVLLLLFGIPVGGSVWLDVAGRTHDRVISARHERIWVSDDGDWARRYELALARRRATCWEPR